MPEDPEDLLMAAAMSFSYLAVRFITQPDNWQAFLAYCAREGRAPLPLASPEQAEPLIRVAHGMMLHPPRKAGNDKTRGALN